MLGRLGVKRWGAYKGVETKETYGKTEKQRQPGYESEILRGGESRFRGEFVVVCFLGKVRFEWEH